MDGLSSEIWTSLGIWTDGLDDREPWSLLGPFVPFAETYR